MTKSLASEWDQFAAFMTLSARPPAEVATLRHVFLAGCQATLNILVEAAKEMMATGRTDPFLQRGFLQRGAELGREIDRLTKASTKMSAYESSSDYGGPDLKSPTAVAVVAVMILVFLLAVRGVLFDA